MSRPLHMSPEHVEKINALLETSREIRESASTLDRLYLILFRLKDTPQPVDPNWQLVLDPAEGVRFALGPPDTDPDVVVQGDYAQMIAIVKARREGEPPPFTLDTEGDASVFEKIAPVWEIAMRVGTIDVEFPDV